MRHSKWLLLVVLAVAQFMVVLDVVVVNVALPAILRSLHFTASSLQWVVTAYALAFGGFLLLGGRTADWFGRKRTLMAGLAGFMTTSLLIGLSRSGVMLIALRALQGLSAAFMSPAALSIVLATFKEGRERSTALSIWSTVAIAGQAVGLVAGGLITQYIGWRWNFFINVPIGIGLLAMVWKVVPELPTTSKQGSLDGPGAALATGGLLALAYAFSQAPEWGWLSMRLLGLTGIAIAALVGFVAWETKAVAPLVPLAIFRSRNLVGANLMMALLFAGVLANLFLSSQYIQVVMRYSPARAGLAFLAIPASFMITAPRVPRLLGRYGYKRLLVAGSAFVAFSMLWRIHLPANGSYVLNLLPPFVLIAVGMSINLVALISAGTQGLTNNQAGLASGLISTSQQMGGALGLAVLSSIATSASRVSTNVALAHGFSVAFGTAAAFAVAAIALSVFLIREPQTDESKISAPSRLLAEAELT